MSIIYDALKKTQEDSHKPSSRQVGNNNQKRILKTTDTDKLRLILSLVVVIIAVWLIVGRLGKQPKNAASTPAYSKPELTIEETNKTHESIKPSPLSYIQPVVSSPDEQRRAETNLPNLVLDGILVSEDRNLALINDRILEVGDEIKEAKILEITPRQVVMVFGNRRIILKTK